ncbi:MAG: glycosyltransferase family 2 protein [Thermoplasmata archaeon]
MSEVDYSVVIPVRNEEDAIGGVLKDIKETMEKLDISYEVIVVDNASTDNTLSIVEEFGEIRLIKHEIDRGYGNSIKEGVKAARSNIVITTDGDGTYPVREIPNLLNYINDYDMVTSARVGKNVSLPLIRRLGKLVHTTLISLLSGEYVSDMNSGLRVFKKDVFMKFYHLFPSGFSISTTFLLACLNNGHPVKFIPIDYYPRKGHSKINIFRDGFNFIVLMLRAITYFNPLRIFLPTGLTFFMMGAFYAVYSLTYHSSGGFPEISVLLITTSILIALFGLLADAISKVLMHMKVSEES